MIRLLMKGMVIFGLVAGVTFMQGANLNAAAPPIAAFHGDSVFEEIPGTANITAQATAGGLRGAVTAEIEVLTSGLTASFSSKELVDLLITGIDFTTGKVTDMRLTYANATRTVNNCTDTGTIVVNVSLEADGLLFALTSYTPDLGGCPSTVNAASYVGHGILK